MKHLSIFGTSSDVGKSLLSIMLTYLFAQKGIRSINFKAQNVSNNSKVCDDGGEIAIPQHFAAEILGEFITHKANPILLKSAQKRTWHLIVNGRSKKNLHVKEYFHEIPTLKPIVKEAFESLAKEYECIVAEGAGSPVELNLMQKDLSNLYIAKEFQTKIVLVADIERGGVFASIYGVYKLLPKEIQKNVIGVIINKFRGDLSLFDEGKWIIRERFGLEVFGVIPYKPFNLAYEDSASLMNYHQTKTEVKIKVGVVRFPHISNFTDFEPLVIDTEIDLEFITTPKEAKKCDMVILPGSKMVVEDLRWLKEQGFEHYIHQTKQKIVAICGGYEMLFERILDPYGVESEHKEIEAFGIFKGDVVFEREKVVQKGCYNIRGVMVEGYEIHNAIAKKRAKKKKNVYGTFVHGIFESDALRKKLFANISQTYKGYDFKKYKQNAVKEYAEFVSLHVNIDEIIKRLKK